MRSTLRDSSLIRQAGRFVWLELDFDNPANQQVLSRLGVTFTPSFFVIDPGDGHPDAVQLGGMTLPELLAFLDRGEAGFLEKPKTLAGAALARGDELLALGQPDAAASKYQEALNLGGKDWPQRDRAMALFTRSLSSSRQLQLCAQTAAQEAPGMTRGPEFGRVLLFGLACVTQAGAEPWAENARQILGPLVAEAIR